MRLAVISSLLLLASLGEAVSVFELRDMGHNQLETQGNKQASHLLTFMDQIWSFLQKRRLLEIPKRRRPPYILKRDYGTWSPKRPYILRRDAGGVGVSASDGEGPEARGSQECLEWHQKGYDLMKTLCKWRGF